jgi:hypothetical protein
MAKLTRKQRAELLRALGHAERAYRYLHHPDVAVCIRRHMATTTLDYTRPGDGAVLYEITKNVGSDLVGLEDAICCLSAILNEGTGV